jgi:aldose 1-epimerase
MTPQAMDPSAAGRAASPQSSGLPHATARAGQTFPVTGRQFEIAAGDYRAVVTELGAGLRELSWRDEPIISGYQADELPPGAAGQLLAPWPNRVDHGRYTFDGHEYQLDLSEAARGNAIHGLTRWASWVAVVHHPDRVLLKHVPHGYTGYPFSLSVDAVYRLTPDDGLQVTISAANRGTRPAPYGTGQHPYLTTGAATVDDFELTLPATKWLPTDDRGIPSGTPQDIDGTPYDFRTPRAIGSTELDHALTGLRRESDGLVRARLRSRGRQVELWAGEGYTWLQVFTGDTLGDDRRRRSLAVEPMTCPPNAFVTGDDVIVLQPGGSVTHTWGIRTQAS